MPLQEDQHELTSFENEQGKDKDTLQLNSSKYSESRSNAKLYETLGTGNVKFQDGNQTNDNQMEEANNPGQRSVQTADVDSITKTKNFLKLYDKVIGTYYYEELARQNVPSDIR